MEVGLSRLIRDKSNDITTWRSEGLSWPEIEERIKAMGVNPGTNSVRNLYHRELARSRNPKQVAALRWAHENYSVIKGLLDQSYGWIDISILLPLEQSPTTSPTLNTLIVAFRTVDAIHATARASALVDQPAQSLPVSPEPALPPPEPISRPSDASTVASVDAHPHCGSSGPELATIPARPRTLREQAQSSVGKNSDKIKIADLGQASRETQGPHAPIREDATPPPRRPRSRALQKMLERQQEENKALAAEKAEKGRLKAQELDYQPNDDPYVKGEDLRSEIHCVSQKVVALVREASRSIPDERKTIQTRIDALNLELSHLNSDFRTRHCHSKANRAVLATLSAAALACGAFRIADESETIEVLRCKRPAIRLAGYDRPDQIEGVPEIPDPLFVIENFSDNDLSRIKEAYDADRAEVPAFDHSAATPRRRLTEAALLRGAYVWRIEGWCAYDDYIRLEGLDHPSPSLVADSPLAATAVDYYLDAIERGYAPSINLAPPLTGTEPDWDRLEPWKRDKLKTATGGWLDNDRGYGS